MRLLLRIALVLGLGVAAAVVAGAGTLVGFWAYLHVIVGLPIRELPALVRFPPIMPVSARATNTVRIRLNGFIDARVPFRQTLSLPLRGGYDTDIAFDTWIPIAFTVRYRGTIPVSTVASIRGVTDFNYEKVKRFRNIAFTAKLPLHFQQPVSLTVPVSARVHLVYRGPLHVGFDQIVSVPVDTVLHTRLKAEKDITTPILASFGMNVGWPVGPVPLVIQSLDIGLALKSLRLEIAPGGNLPSRGPADPLPATRSE